MTVLVTPKPNSESERKESDRRRRVACGKTIRAVRSRPKEMSSRARNARKNRSSDGRARSARVDGLLRHERSGAVGLRSHDADAAAVSTETL